MHLKDDQSDISKAFIELLKEIKNLSAIYIVGDLFEFWLGYDVAQQKLKKTLDQIKKTNKETPIYFCAGNRERFITEKCAEKIGFTLIDDIAKLKLFNKNIVITHGDILCTLDTGYQIFRVILQNRIIKYILLNISKEVRLKIFSFMRKLSQKFKKNKPPETTDINKKSSIFKKISKNDVIIHGHTHKQIEETNQDYKRIVLGEWKDESSILIYGCSDYKIFNYKTNNIDFKEINSYIIKESCNN